MKNLLFDFFLVTCLVACSTEKESTFVKRMTEYPQRTLADWQPDKAVAEAQRDIAAGNPKIYYTGTVVAYAPGVPADQFHKVQLLPKADAGLGYLVKDAQLHKAQIEYAARYNSYVVQHWSGPQAQVITRPRSAHLGELNSD